MSSSQVPATVLDTVCSDTVDSELRQAEPQAPSQGRAPGCQSMFRSPDTDSKDKRAGFSLCVVLRLNLIQVTVWSHRLRG